jgi:leucyl-tRNA synthetase
VERRARWKAATASCAAVWNFGVKLGPPPAAPAAAAGKDAQALRREIHSVLRQVDYDYSRMQYNTVVSGAMKMLNALEDFKGDADSALREGFGILLRVLYPVTPHIAATLWQQLGYATGQGRPAGRAVAAGRRGRRWCRTRSSWCCR